MVVSLVVLVAWVMMGCGCVWFDHYVIAHKLDWINIPMVAFLILIPCFPFIFHWCGLF